MPKDFHQELSERKRELTRVYRKRKVRRYPSLLAHWARLFLRSPQRSEAKAVSKPKDEQVAIHFVGHATALIQYSELSILCDPMFRNWRGMIRREQRPGLEGSDLQETDLILITSQEADHLDPKSLSQLPSSATVILPPGCAKHISALGFARVIELAPGQGIEHRGVDVQAVRAESGDEQETVLAYILRGNGPSVFFCGSSGYFAGFAHVGRRYRPDIAILPIGGYSPNSFRQRHMSPLDALYAFEDLHSKVMIPIRYGSFALSYEKLSEPLIWLEELMEEKDLQNYVVPIAPGQSRLFVRPKEQRRPAPRASMQTSSRPDTSF